MIFAVIFPNGFGITENIGVLKHLLETYEVEAVKTTPDVGHAYWQCCKLHVDKLIPLPCDVTKTSIYLPTLQDVLQRPYFTGEPKAPTQPRFFACVSLVDVAIIDNVDDLISFVQECSLNNALFELKCEENYERAHLWLNWKASQLVFYCVAYATAPIPQIPFKIGINRLFTNPMPKFFKQNVQFPKELPQPHPNQFQLPIAPS